MSYFGHETFKQDVLDAINDASETYDVTGELLLSELHLILSALCSEIMNKDKVWKEAYAKGKVDGRQEILNKIQSISD